MQDLSRERCFNHALREAVARCPECGRYFCRECVTEHEGRVVCSACLRKLAKLSLGERAGLTVLLELILSLGGMLLAWMFFYYVGLALLRLPDSFHEGSLWRTAWSVLR